MLQDKTSIYTLPQAKFSSLFHTAILGILLLILSLNLINYNCLFPLVPKITSTAFRQYQLILTFLGKSQFLSVSPFSEKKKGHCLKLTSDDDFAYHAAVTAVSPSLGTTTHFLVDDEIYVSIYFSLTIPLSLIASIGRLTCPLQSF